MTSKARFSNFNDFLSSRFVALLIVLLLLVLLFLILILLSLSLAMTAFIDVFPYQYQVSYTVRQLMLQSTTAHLLILCDGPWRHLFYHRVQRSQVL